MRKSFVIISSTKPSYDAGANWKTYELFIYGEIHGITNSLYKNVLKVATP
jgi:hypothetical protein